MDMYERVSKHVYDWPAAQANIVGAAVGVSQDTWGGVRWAYIAEEEKETGALYEKGDRGEGIMCALATPASTYTITNTWLGLPAC